MRRSYPAGLAAVAIAASAASAQLLPPLDGPSESAAAAWSALLGTPSGALPPLMTPTIAGGPSRSPQLAFRYGHMGGGNDLVSLNNFALTALFPAGTGATLSLTGGIIHPSCDGCDDNNLMLSVGGDLGLYSSPLGPSSDAGRLTVSLNGEFGYGKPSDGRLLAGTVGLPFALVLGSSMRIVPYVTPAFGFGSSTESGTSVSGSRFLLGGGIGLYNPESSVSVHGGFQQIFINDAKMVFGVALSVGGR